MKAKEINVGSRYMAKVNGFIVPIMVVAAEAATTWGGRPQLRYRCRNERTGREIVVRSPQRFRCAATTL